MKLLECEISGLLEHICMMKEYFDEGCTRIVEIFKDFNEDFDECEAFCMELFYDVCKYVNYDELYYENDAGEIDDYSEADGEVWTFSSDEMRAFYRLLAEFPPPVYQQQCKEMQSLASEYIMAAQDAYAGVEYELVYEPADNEPPHLNVYLSYDYYYEAFPLVCGLVALFDTYANKLRELQSQEAA